MGYLSFEKRTANLFFQVVIRRYERGSMLITSNQMVTQWDHVFGDELIAAAILDRLLHDSYAGGGVKVIRFGAAKLIHPFVQWCRGRVYRLLASLVLEVVGSGSEGVAGVSLVPR